MRRWRLILGGALLAAQLAWIVYAQFQPWRWFAWSPNDYVTRYRVEAVVAGRTLTADDLCDRYGREFCNPSNDATPPEYVDEGPPEHIVSEIRQYEQLHGKGDGAVVTVSYTSTSEDGPKVWRWPDDTDEDYR